MENQTKKKQLKYYNLSEVEKFLAEYEQWYHNQQVAQTLDDDGDSGSNPGTPPPPPPGSQP